MEITIREANQSDFHQLKELLTQLTTVGNPTADQINQDIYNNVCVAQINNMIVGCATLLIEDKIIHEGGKVGHIEDVTVNNYYRGKGIGKLLIDHCVNIAKEEGCYKIILDCDCGNIMFYEKCGFKIHGVCMRIDIN